MSERDGWIDDVATALERRIAAAGARPDFLDVIARARAIDPDTVPALDSEAVLELELGSPTVGTTANEATDEPDEPDDEQDAMLDEWIGDVRAAVERHVDVRKQTPPPALEAHRQRRATWWVAGAALAAGIVLVLGASQIVRTVALGSSMRPDQALHQGDHTEHTSEPTEHRSAPARPHPEGVRETEVVGETATTTTLVEPEPEPEPEPELAPPSPRRSSAAADRSPSLAEELSALADEAQAHWRAGRRDEAQRAFALIVSRGGRSRAAEMAFADLFTLAHQQGDAAAQRRWWKAYLRRFPAGRFADDARAGLCRSTATAEQARCWTEYLDDFPRGSFRDEARAGSGDAPR